MRKQVYRSRCVGKGWLGQLAGLCLVIMAGVSPFYLFIRTFSPTFPPLDAFPLSWSKHQFLEVKLSGSDVSRGAYCVLTNICNLIDYSCGYEMSNCIKNSGPKQEGNDEYRQRPVKCRSHEAQFQFLFQ